MNKGMFLPNANGPAHPCHRSRTSPSAPVPGDRSPSHLPSLTVSWSDHGNGRGPNANIPKHRCCDAATRRQFSQLSALLTKSRPGPCNPAASPHTSPTCVRSSARGTAIAHDPGLRRRRRRRLGASTHLPIPAIAMRPDWQLPSDDALTAQRSGREMQLAGRCRGHRQRDSRLFFGFR